MINNTLDNKWVTLWKNNDPSVSFERNFIQLTEELPSVSTCGNRTVILSMTVSYLNEIDERVISPILVCYHTSRLNEILSTGGLNFSISMVTETGMVTGTRIFYIDPFVRDIEKKDLKNIFISDFFIQSYDVNILGDNQDGQLNQRTAFGYIKNSISVEGIYYCLVDDIE